MKSFIILVITLLFISFANTQSYTPCSSDNDCDLSANEFCYFPIGDCGNSGDEGECKVVPEICPLFFIETCGCDGVTYGNECDANSAGVSVDYFGECGRSSFSTYSSLKSSFTSIISSKSSKSSNNNNNNSSGNSSSASHLSLAIPSLFLFFFLILN